LKSSYTHAEYTERVEHTLRVNYMVFLQRCGTIQSIEFTAMIRVYFMLDWVIKEPCSGLRTVYLNRQVGATEARPPDSHVAAEMWHKNEPLEIRVPQDSEDGVVSGCPPLQLQC